jgi:YidC/Oxa1 family membrane protein insertase
MIVLANVLQPLIDVSESILTFFHDDLGWGWGASIIGLTIVVRLLILPLTFKGVRSMQALQRLQPEIKKIQERYKGDKQRMNQEMMAFYQEQKVNPLSSCLPLVLQLPFFISLFYMLRKDLREDICGQTAKACGKVVHDSGQFLFIPDITDRATGGVLVTLVVLYVGTQLGASLVTAISADPNQRRIMLALPFVFVIFIINFQAGLLVYWITTNVWTVGQQLFVKKFLPPPEPLAAAGGGDDGAAAKPARGKPPPPKPASAKAAVGGGAESQKAPPPPPRRKRKRSGRRR